MKTQIICGGVAVLTALSVYGHLPECPETLSAQVTFASGAQFELEAAADSLSASGTVTYDFAAEGIFLSSGDLVTYGFLYDNGRYLDFAAVVDGEPAVIRVLAWDYGETGDTLVIQLHAGGMLVYEDGAEFGADVVQLSGGCGDGSLPPEGEEPLPPDGGGDDDGEFDASPRTIGYWKNHDAHLAEVLAGGAIDLGDTIVVTVEDALAVLNSASARDARDMLRAQLLGTLLNLANGTDPMLTGEDITVAVEASVEFLATHDSPVKGGHPDREEALALKDALDGYNNN